MKRQRRFLLTLWGLLALSALVMAQTYSFSGRVTNERRVAIDGAQVLLSASDSLAAMALTDPEGRFRIEGLARGSYRVVVLLAGYNTFERALEIKAGDERADFLLTPEARVDLEGVTVTGNRADLVERTATGEIFHLSEKMKGEARNIYQALREIPLLSVNETDRDIRMADGSTPIILVNGVRRSGAEEVIDPEMSIHDFRVTWGPEHKNLIFDVVVPHKSKLTDEQVRERITRAVQVLDPNCYVVLQIDRAYTENR